MKILDITNPENPIYKTTYTLNANMSIYDVDIDEVSETNSDFICVIDKENNTIGSIRKDTLIYLFYKEKEPIFSILQSIDEGIIAVDNDSRIFYANTAYTSILGVPLHKLLGRCLNTIEPTAALLKTLADSKPRTIKKQLIASINKYVSTKTFPLYMGDEQVGAYSVFTDTTIVNELNQKVDLITGIADNYNSELMTLKSMQKNKVIGKSRRYKECVEKALFAAKTDVAVLLRGENGSGKEVIAQMIVDSSKRAEKPLIIVNCSAIPENLIESELFGYEAGAFTGSKKGGNPGKFELANGGTIFLDEIGDLPLSIQPKLLRVLQNGEIEKIGRQATIPVDVRLIAATNRPLEDMIKEKTFRADLYYRLNVLPITIPPLRERSQDIILLAHHFLKHFCEKYDRKMSISAEVLKIFSSYEWPGNVRELQNTIESAVVLCQDDMIRINHLPEWFNNFYSTSYTPEFSDFSNTTHNTVTSAENPVQNIDTKEYGFLSDEMNIYEKHILISTLNRFDGNRKKAMETLGMTKRTFYRKLSHHGLTGK